MQYVTDESSLLLLGLSVRSNNALLSIGIDNVGKLLRTPVEQYLYIKNIGKKSADEIISVISDIRSGQNDLLYAGTFYNDNTPIQTNNIKVFCDKQGVLRKDIPIEYLGLSVRAYHCLLNHGKSFASEIISMTKEDLLLMKNSGVKTASEIMNKIKTLSFETVHESKEIFQHDKRIVEYIFNDFLAGVKEYMEIDEKILHTVLEEPITEFIVKYKIKTEKAVKQYVKNYEFIRLLYSQEYLRNTVKAYILNTMTEYKYGLTQEELVKRLSYTLKDTGIFDELLDELIQAEALLVIGDVIRKRYPNISDYIKSFRNKKNQAILIERFEGKTYNEIAAKNSVTRQCVQQKIIKLLNKRPRLAEDIYIDVFEKYYFSIKDFTTMFNETEVTYNYLNSICNKGRLSSCNLSEDMDFPIDFRKSVANIKTDIEKKACVKKKKILIEGKLIDKKSSDILLYITKDYFKGEETSLKEVVLKYNELIEKNIPVLEKQKERRCQMGYASLENKLASSNFILWKANKKLRYYDISGYDFKELLNSLNLDQYNNVEYSTLKFFRENTRLMNKYDIHDEYELHNLLKKIYKNDNNYNVRFCRMPIIEFGNADRDIQVWELMKKHSPISHEKLAYIYESVYGVKAATVKTNYLCSFSQYLHYGVYIINDIYLPYDHTGKLKELLKGDFYTISEIKEIYKNSLPDAQPDKINRFTVISLGFKMYSFYCIKDKYETASQFFCKMLSEVDYFDFANWPKKMHYLHIFTIELTRLKNQLDMIELSPSKYMNIRKFNEIGITKTHLKDYCNKVHSFCEQDDFFTIRILRRNGFSHQLDQLGYDEWFYSSILSHDTSKFSFIRIGKVRLFLKGVKNPELIDFISFLSDKHNTLDPDILLEVMDQEYGINIQKQRFVRIMKMSRINSDT